MLDRPLRPAEKNGNTAGKCSGKSTGSRCYTSRTITAVLEARSASQNCLDWPLLP